MFEGLRRTLDGKVCSVSLVYAAGNATQRNMSPSNSLRVYQRQGVRVVTSTDLWSLQPQLSLALFEQERGLSWMEGGSLGHLLSALGPAFPIACVCTFLHTVPEVPQCSNKLDVTLIRPPVWTGVKFQ